MPLMFGDLGTTVEVTIRKDDGSIYDVSTASQKEIIIIKPSKAELVKTASFVTDGTDGKIKYVVQTGDLDELGAYSVRAHVVIGALNLKSTYGQIVVQQ